MGNTMAAVADAGKQASARIAQGRYRHPVDPLIVSSFSIQEPDNITDLEEMIAAANTITEELSCDIKAPFSLRNSLLPSWRQCHVDYSCRLELMPAKKGSSMLKPSTKARFSDSGTQPHKATIHMDARQFLRCLQSLRVLLVQVKQKIKEGNTPVSGDECVICYEIPHKPLVLECTHGPFCEKCLSDWIQDIESKSGSGGGDAAEEQGGCPLCRRAANADEAYVDLSEVALHAKDANVAVTECVLSASLTKE